MLKGPEQFTYPYQYRDYLHGMYEVGTLQAQTMSPEAHHATVNKVLEIVPQRGLYLEVGQSADPYCVGSARQFAPGVARYLGVDGGHSRYVDQAEGDTAIGWTYYGRSNASTDMNVAHQAVKGAFLEGSASVVWGDAAHLPLRDASEQPLPLRETFMRDVVEQPMMHRSSLQQIFTEQARVLGEAGHLIIRETFSPASSYISVHNEMATQHLEVLACLERTGFTQRAMITDDRMVASVLKRHFPGGAENLNTQGYYLICQQGEKPVEPTRMQRVRASLRRLALGSNS
ncbi:MAG TPA: hypothetical protein VFI74_05115 [Candidatus Saccharimonadales bacterium]|nr:hypothetical protein [Candidatus Saccharimonadales bacterium]